MENGKWKIEGTNRSLKISSLIFGRVSLSADKETL